MKQYIFQGRGRKREREGKEHSPPREGSTSSQRLDPSSTEPARADWRRTVAWRRRWRRLGDERVLVLSLPGDAPPSLTPGSEKDGGVHHRALASPRRCNLSLPREQGREHTSNVGIAVGVEEDEGDMAATSLSR